MIKKIPKKYKDALSAYGPQIYDPICAEIVGWGHRLIKWLIKEDFEHLRYSSSYGTIYCYGGSWYLIIKWLTPQEAIEKYGKMTHLEIGPKGGFRSVTYGEKKFITREMDPRMWK